MRLLKVIAISIGTIVGVSIFAISLLFALYFIDEWRDGRRFEELRMPSVVLSQISRRGVRLISEILMPGETNLCVLPEYVSVEVLKGEVSSAQFSALSRERFPHRDIAWYMIFLSEERVSRAYVVSQLRLDPPAAACRSRDAVFEVIDANEKIDTRSTVSLQQKTGAK